MMKNAFEEKEDLYALVLTELKNLGVKVPKVKKFKSNVVKQEKSISETRNKVFGVCLSDQEWISECGCALPKFIVSATSYLKDYINAEIGLFRKAGSVVRQRELRAKLEKGDGFVNCEPNDVASLLKQWLRELPEPVVPQYLHDLFVKCHGLENSEDRLTAVLSACLLLPSEHLYTLKHLLLFLASIASNSDVNKMVPHNLAVVMAPNLFSCGNERIEKSGNTSLVQCYTALVELLIVHSEQVGNMPIGMIRQGSIKLQNNLDFPIQSLDGSPMKTQKKRRSGGMSDLVSGIRKFVGGNMTPIAHCFETSDDYRVPATRSAPKRKAGPDPRPMSDVKKRQGKPENVGQSPNFAPAGKTRFMNSLSTPQKAPPSNTPLSHVRRKSFGLLGKKKQKRAKVKTTTFIDENASVSTHPPPKATTSTEVAENVVIQPKQNMDHLKVPKPEYSLTRKESSVSSLAKTQKAKITRAHSDQPLPSTVHNKLTTMKSTSQENLRGRKSPNVHVKLCTKRSKSPMMTIKPKKPSPRSSTSKSQGPPASTIKRSTSSTSNHEKQPFRRNGSTRRSSRRRVNPNRSAQKANTSKSNIIQKVLEEKDDVLLDGQNQGMADVFESEKGSDGTDPPLTPSKDISLIKRGGTKSSLRRGRPNTVKTGLPSERCPKYSTDSMMSLKFDLSEFELPVDLRNNKSSIDGDDNVFESETVPKRRSGRTSGSRFSPRTTDVLEMVESKDEDIPDGISVPEIPNCVVIPMIVTEIPLATCQEIDSAVGNDKENLKADKVMDVEISKDTDGIQDEEQWQCAKTFLASHLFPVDVPACKRESIVQILSKNAGKVQASVQHYNTIAVRAPKVAAVADPTVPTNILVQTPTKETKMAVERQFSAPRSKFQNVHGDFRLTRSESRLTSRSCRYRKSPLPLPPKFSVAESTTQPSPLKEVTNLTKVLSITSPINNQGASPVLPPAKKGSLKEKGNKVSEAKTSTKARRSKSSPSLSKPTCRQSQRIKESTSRTPSPVSKLLLTHSQSFNSSRDGLGKRNRLQKVASKRAIHCLEESVTNQMMVDEWQCDM